METVILPDDKAGVEYAASLLQAGEPVALPTETVYGLAANALDPVAVAKIYQAKGRPSDNPLIVHVTGIEQGGELAAEIPQKGLELMQAFWPGPLTIVVPKNPVIPGITTGGRPDVGLRAPAHPAFQAVLQAAQLPLAAPSANVAGRPSPTTAQHVLQDMNGRIPAILDGGPCAVGVESTVVSVTGTIPVLLRPGGVSLEQLQTVVGPVIVDAAVTAQMEAGRSPGAPGMKYQHYAPRTPLTLITGPIAHQVEIVRAASADRATAEQAGEALQRLCPLTQPAGGQACVGGSVGVLCFDDDAALFSGLPHITYGPRHDAAAQAQQLFSALHQIDSLGVSQVYAQISPSQTGVFLAVRNRLLKAAGHRIIELA